MDLTKQEIRTAQAAAASLQRTYGIDMHDIQQEMLAWCLTHEAKVLEFRSKPGLYTTLVRLGVKYCRKEWRASGAPHLDELIQQRYSRKALRGLIPLALTTDLGQLSPVSIEYSSSGGDPAVGGDLLASLVDVRRALKALPAAQGEALVLAVELGWDNNLLGEFLKDGDDQPIGAETARARINYYLDNMRKVLNGQTWDGREVSSDEDAEAYYRAQLKGLKEYTGRRWVQEDRDGEAVTENYYRAYGASWDGVE